MELCVSGVTWEAPTWSKSDARTSRRVAGGSGLSTMAASAMVLTNNQSWDEAGGGPGAMGTSSTTRLATATGDSVLLEGCSPAAWNTAFTVGIIAIGSGVVPLTMAASCCPGLCGGSAWSVRRCRAPAAARGGRLAGLVGRPPRRGGLARRPRRLTGVGALPAAGAGAGAGAGAAVRGTGASMWGRPRPGD